MTCAEYKALCSGKNEHNTSLSTTLHIFKHGGGCIMLGVCLSLERTREFFRINKRNKAKHRQKSRGELGSVCFPTDTGRQIHLSALPKTQGQIYTGVAYQDGIEFSWVAELQFWLKLTWKSMTRPLNRCLLMVNKPIWQNWKNFENNNCQMLHNTCVDSS